MDDTDLQQAVQKDLQLKPRVDAAHGAPSAGFLHIVVGYDGSAPASRALDAAVRLLQGRTGRIAVVWVAHLSSTVRLSADAIVETEAAFDELEPELRAQAAGQLRGRGADWEFERRQGVRRGGVDRRGGRHPRCPPRPERGDRDRELVPCHSPHGRFGRRQPGPPFTGSPRDRAIGSRCSKPRPGPGIRRMRTVTPRSVRNNSIFLPNDP
jgi:Universal stress protein family